MYSVRPLNGSLSLSLLPFLSPFFPLYCTRTLLTFSFMFFLLLPEARRHYHPKTDMNCVISPDVNSRCFLSYTLTVTPARSPSPEEGLCRQLPAHRDLDLPSVPCNSSLHVCFQTPTMGIGSWRSAAASRVLCSVHL